MKHSRRRQREGSPPRESGLDRAAPAAGPAVLAVPVVAVTSQAGARTGRDRRGGGWVGWGLLVGLVLAGVHLWGRVEPELRYALATPEFFLDGAFLERFGTRVGGVIEGMAAGMAAWNQFNVAGAVAFTVLVGVLVAGAWRLALAVEGGASGLGAGLWLALLAALPGRYPARLEETLLGVAVAIGLALVWRWIPGRASRVRWGVLVVGAAGLVAVAGPRPVLLAVALIALIEAGARGRPGYGLACLLAAGVVPAWAWWQPGLASLGGSEGWGRGYTVGLMGMAWGFVPAWLLVAWGRRAWRERGLAGATCGAGPAVTVKQRVRAVVVCLVLPGVVWLALDAGPRAEARVRRAVAAEDWQGALAAGAARPGLSVPMRVDLVRALYHTGGLPGELFRLPLQRGAELLPGYREGGLQISRPLAWTLYELGQVNLAEHLAHESLELEGARPDTLRLLARINVLKDRPGAARIFLNRLGLAPFHGAEAASALRALEEDPRGAQDPGLSRIRAGLPTTDVAAARLPTEMLLRQCLSANPTNAMARAYLLSHLLLSVDLDGLERESGRTVASGAAVPLPRACAEALVWRRLQAGDAGSGTNLTSIPPAMVERGRRFAREAQERRGDAGAAGTALAPEFGDTFWYYVVFGRTVPGHRVGEAQP